MKERPTDLQPTVASTGQKAILSLITTPTRLTVWTADNPTKDSIMFESCEPECVIDDREILILPAESRTESSQ